MALDKLDYLFANEKISIDFFTLLRAWHESSKVDPKWSKLRLILVYDDNPPSIESNKSPFKDLAHRHKLNYSDAEVEELIKKVGTHPYLIRQALYEINTQNLSLDQFWQQNLIQRSPYKDYLSS